jgi:hypothetical protein
MNYLLFLLLTALVHVVDATVETCPIKKTRPKILSKEVCLKKKDCEGKRFMGLQYSKSTTEVDVKDFEGYCYGNNCEECQMTDEDELAYLQWKSQTDTVPPPLCYDKTCGSDVNGGMYAIYVLLFSTQVQH